MKQIKIRDKEYNCSNKVYYHIQGLESENRVISMELLGHENNELQQQKEIEKLSKKSEILEENNKLLIQQKSQLYEDLDIAYKRIDEAIEYIEENEVVDYNPTLDGSEDDSYMELPRSLTLFNEELDILLDILKGDDKE